MKVILVMVASVNGKTTKGDDPHIQSWTSKEDQQYFSELIQSQKVIIMGSHTYDAVKKIIKLSPDRLRLVMSKNAQKYETETVPNQLEFTDMSPQDLINDLENRGVEQILLAGGASLNGSFLKANLVSDIYLTLEPKLFGQGKNLTPEFELEKDLKLISLEKLNDQGTLLLKYQLVD